jgi:hypothetical protein
MMGWLGQVEKTFWQTVNKADVPEELKKSLKHSERTPHFIRGVADELTKAERHLLLKKNKKLKLKTIIGAIEDLTKGFLANIEVMADRKRESLMEKLKREEAIRYQEDLQKTVDGKASGVFEDLDIKSMGIEVEEFDDGKNGQTD